MNTMNLNSVINCCSRCGNDLNIEKWLADEYVNKIYNNPTTHLEMKKSMDELCYDCYMKEINDIIKDVLNICINDENKVNTIIQPKFFKNNGWIKFDGINYQTIKSVELVKKLLIIKIRTRYDENVDFILSRRKVNENVFELSVWIKPRIIKITDEEEKLIYEDVNRILFKIKSEYGIDLILDKLISNDKEIVLKLNNSDSWINSWDSFDVCNRNHHLHNTMIKFYSKSDIHRFIMKKIVQDLTSMYDLNHFQIYI
jgi:hypothetical protein